MSECKHEYLLDVQGGFYYCPNCPDEWTIQDLLRADIENHARIKALEGVIDWAEKVVEMAERLSVNGICPLCTGGEVGCLVKHMEAALKKLEEL